jgi:hypothetical protein
VCFALVPGVRGRLELEGRVDDVEMPGDAFLQRVEKLRRVTGREAVVLNHDVR